MNRAALPLALALALASPTQAQDALVVPSGLALVLYHMDVVEQSEQGGILFIGFLASDLANPAANLTFGDVLPDFDRICVALALPEAAARLQGGDPLDAVVIRLADRPLQWGETDPQAKQFMASYFIGEGACEWR